MLPSRGFTRHLPAVAVVALVENSCQEVGLASLSLSDYSVQLSQFCDDQAYSKTTSMLTCYEPRQLLFPPGSQGGVLERICKNEFTLARFELIPRRQWSETRGSMLVRHFTQGDSTVDTDAENKCMITQTSLRTFACVPLPFD